MFQPRASWQKQLGFKITRHSAKVVPGKSSQDSQPQRGFSMIYVRDAEHMFFEVAAQASGAIAKGQARAWGCGGVGNSSMNGRKIGNGIGKPGRIISGCVGKNSDRIDQVGSGPAVDSIQCDAYRIEIDGRSRR